MKLKALFIFMKMATICAIALAILLAPVTAIARQKMGEYELCLIARFIDEYKADPLSVNSFLDVENLLISVAPDCAVERYLAAFEYVEIMTSTDELANASISTVEAKIEENMILNLAVELHVRMF